MSDTPRRWFDKNAPDRSPAHARIYALHEVLRTFVDFAAALLFLVGSILFFDQATLYAGTWMFVIGSVFFALKPTLRLFREMQYIRADEVSKVAALGGDG